MRIFHIESLLFEMCFRNALYIFCMPPQLSLHATESAVGFGEDAQSIADSTIIAGKRGKVDSNLGDNVEGARMEGFCTMVAFKKYIYIAKLVMCGVFDQPFNNFI